MHKHSSHLCTCITWARLLYTTTIMRQSAFIGSNECHLTIRTARHIFLGRSLSDRPSPLVVPPLEPLNRRLRHGGRLRRLRCPKSHNRTVRPTTSSATVRRSVARFHGSLLRLVRRNRTRLPNDGTLATGRLPRRLRADQRDGGMRDSSRVRLRSGVASVAHWTQRGTRCRGQQLGHHTRRPIRNSTRTPLQ